MSIVLRENEWAEDMIQSRSLGKKPSETLRRIARYYLDKGYNKRDTRRMLDMFLSQCDPNISLPKWSDSLDYALNRAAKCSAIYIDSVEITDTEMNKIDAVDGRQAKRLAFTLLCLAKYWHIVIPNCDYWVNTPDNEIMSMANIKNTIKRQCAIYKELKDAGLIQFSKKIDNTNVKVLFVGDGEPVMQISDFRNLGYQYLKHHGEAYYECQNCGITTKYNSATGRKPKYCKTCAMSIYMQQSVNSVMRQRNRSSNTV